VIDTVIGPNIKKRCRKNRSINYQVMIWERGSWSPLLRSSSCLG